MLQRQRAAGLDLTERKAGVQILDVGQVDQDRAGKLGEGIEIPRNHLQFEGARPADVVARHHLRNFADRFFQLARHVAGVAVGVQPHKGQHAQANLVAVDLGVVALDETRLFQRLDPAPAGRGRQAHTRGQFSVGEPRVDLQLIQNRQVICIKSFHFLESTARSFQKPP